MIRGLIITHGALGAELVKVATSILGPIEGLSAISNQGRPLRELSGAIGDWLAAETGQEPVVLLVDQYGGSCANAAQLAGGGRKDIRVVAGVNLAMVLGFATWRDSLELAGLTQRIVETGRQAIARLGPTGEPA
jgi:mannose/fructose-specific phosphotransferase system component IIA